MKWVLWVVGVLVVLLWGSWFWMGRDLRELDDVERQRAPGKFAELPGAKIHYKLSGPEGAPVIVMVHGFSTPGFIFDQNAAALREAGYRVLQFDHLGRGWSDRPKARYDADFYDWELLTLLDTLGIKEPAGFVGLSMGGPIVAEFAVRHPQRVNRIFLFVPAGLDVSGTEGYQASLLRTPLVGDWIWRMIGLKTVAGDPQYNEAGLEIGDRLQGDVREQMKYKGYGEALLATFRHFEMKDRDDTWSALAAAKIPVSAVFGSADPTVPVSSAARLSALVPDAKVTILDGGDHGLNYKRHKEVGVMLIDWFEQEPSWMEPAPAAAPAGEEGEWGSDPFEETVEESTLPEQPNTIPHEPSVRPCRMSRINISRCR